VNIPLIVLFAYSVIGETTLLSMTIGTTIASVATVQKSLFVNTG